MLSNSKIKLRPYELEDREILYNWRFDYASYDYFYEFTPPSAFVNEEWLKNTLKDKSQLNFVIEHKGKPVGTIALANIDQRNQKCELSRVFTAEKFRGRGFGSAAAGLLAEYAFKHLNMHKIVLNVFADNEVAIKTYKKNGFKKAGVLKSHIYKNGAFKDVMLMEKIR